MASRDVLIVCARFNEMITRSLHAGAVDALTELGAAQETVWVPGAFELPVVAAKAARSGRYGAVVCLGAVIRGDTPHFDLVAGQAASGLMSVSVETGVPVIFGVLTTDTVEQALNRAGLKHGNKGADAGRAAVQMMDVLKSFNAERGNDR